MDRFDPHHIHSERFYHRPMMESKDRMEESDIGVAGISTLPLSSIVSTSSSAGSNPRSSRRRVSFDALAKKFGGNSSGYGMSNLPPSPSPSPSLNGMASSSGRYSDSPGPSLSPGPSSQMMGQGPSLPTSPARSYRSATLAPPNGGGGGGGGGGSSSSHHSHSHSQPIPSSSPFHLRPLPAMMDAHSEFPFPALTALNRSRLLHLIEYQCRICEQPDGCGGTVDKESLLHYRTLIKAIQSLNLKGGVYNFSFVHSSSIASSLLGSSNPRVHYTSRLTAVHLLDILERVRNSTSPNLAHPTHIPISLLDTGIYYKPDEQQANSMQLSPYVYHRALAFLSLLMNLHIHQLTLSRILELLHGIDLHLDYWLTHQALTSLPKPYRLWKWFQYNFLASSQNPSAASFASTFSGLHSPVKKKSGRAGFFQPESQTRGSGSIDDGQSFGGIPLPPSASASSSTTNPYSKWSRMAARNVRELVDLKKRWTTRAGRIALRMHKLQYWLSESFGKQKPASPSSSHIPIGGLSNSAAAIAFHRQIEMNEIYFGKIYRYALGDELHSSSTSSSASSIQQKIFAMVAQFGSYEHYLVNFESEFVKKFEREINLRRKPHHLFEKWHYYTGACLIVSGIAIYAIRNQHQVRAAGLETAKSLRFFLNEHLVEPITNIYETTFQTFHDRSLFSTNAATLVQSKENLSSMLSEFAHKHASELSSYEDRERSEYLASIPLRADEADMNLVMKPYNREIQHPIRSLLFGDLMHGLLIQVQKVKVDSEAGMLALDQILKSNAVNFNILATIPFFLIGYAMWDVTNKWILRSTWSSKEVRQHVRVCRNILSELEQIFILHLANMTPIDVASGSSSNQRTHSHQQQQRTASSGRSPLHTAIQTLSIDEFASLCSQEQEDEDESLRLNSQSATASHATASGTEIFGNLDQVTSDLQMVSDEEEEEEVEDEAGGHFSSSSSSTYPESSRTLFSHAPHTSSSTSSSSSSSLRRPSVIGLTNHVYGHTLLLIHSLSLHLSTLPLSSAFSSNLLVRSGGASDPRHVLHKDLILLASAELTPEQKYRWIQHIWKAYAFLAQP